jgi:methylated-DNA-[protein]-cysteine S-methyltransferase
MKTFNEQCYDLLRQVPKGNITTYADIAHALGTRAYRAVGNAMNKNPHDIKEVPCHRVIKSNGTLGGYAKEERTKKELLQGEGITFEGNKIKNYKEKLYEFKEP